MLDSSFTLLAHAMAKLISTQNSLSLWSAGQYVTHIVTGCQHFRKIRHQSAECERNESASAMAD